MTKLSPDMVSGYIDDQLSPALREVVEEAMRNDPDVGHEIATAVAQRDSLRALYNPVVSEPVPQRLSARRLEDGHMHRALREYTMAACLIVVVVVGATMALYFRAQEPSSYAEVIESALTAHSDTETPLGSSLSEGEVSALLNVAIAFPDLTALGLTFASANSSLAGDQPRVQLLYNNADGAPTTLYLTGPGKPGSPSLHGVEKGQLHALYWATDSITCTIVSATADINAVAEKAFAQLTPGEPKSSTRVYRDI